MKLLLLGLVAVTMTMVQSMTEKEYMLQRADYLEQNSEIGFDASTAMNEAERIVSDWFVSKRNALELKTLSSFPPHFYFNSEGIKDLVEDNDIFRFIDNMPKGAALHLHDSASGSLEWLVTKGIYFPRCYISITDYEIDYVANGTLKCFPKGSKIPGNFRRAEDIPDVEEIMRDMLSLRNADITLDSAGFWSNFQNMFYRMRAMRYLPFFKEHLRTAMGVFYDNGVRHIDMRLNPMTGYRNENSTKELDSIFAMQSVIDNLNEFIATHPGFSMTFIINGHRHATLDQMSTSLESAFKLRAAFPDYVKGFDMVGQEDPPSGYPTLHYLSVFLQTIPALQAKYGVDMPLFLHDGESDDPSDSNVLDAVLLNSTRIGHGVNTFNLPIAEKLIIERGIALEVCPISNQLLGYVGDMRLHPAAGYIRRGLPVVISSDDPMLFGYTGLSYDFWEAVMSWDLDLRAIKTLALNSIHHSSLDEPRKSVLMKQFRADWASYISTVSMQVSSSKL